VHDFGIVGQFVEGLRQHGDELEAQQRLTTRNDDAGFRRVSSSAVFILRSSFTTTFGSLRASAAAASSAWNSGDGKM
jgi:hypothetical protein